MSSESLAIPPKLPHEEELRRLLSIAIAEGAAQVFFIINEPDAVFVPSRSEPYAGYVVKSPRPGVADCPCLAHQWRGYCTHSALAFWLRRELEPAPLAEVTPLRVLRRPARKTEAGRA